MQCFSHLRCRFLFFIRGMTPTLLFSKCTKTWSSTPALEWSHDLLATSHLSSNDNSSSASSLSHHYNQQLLTILTPFRFIEEPFRTKVSLREGLLFSLLFIQTLLLTPQVNCVLPEKIASIQDGRFLHAFTSSTQFSSQLLRLYLVSACTTKMLLASPESIRLELLIASRYPIKLHLTRLKEQLLDNPTLTARTSSLPFFKRCTNFLPTGDRNINKFLRGISNSSAANQMYIRGTQGRQTISEFLRTSLAGNYKLPEATQERLVFIALQRLDCIHVWWALMEIATKRKAIAFVKEGTLSTDVFTNTSIPGSLQPMDDQSATSYPSKLQTGEIFPSTVGHEIARTPASIAPQESTSRLEDPLHQKRFRPIRPSIFATIHSLTSRVHLLAEQAVTNSSAKQNEERHSAATRETNKQPFHRDPQHLKLVSAFNTILPGSPSSSVKREAVDFNASEPPGKRRKSDTNTDVVEMYTPSLRKVDQTPSEPQLMVGGVYLREDRVVLEKTVLNNDQWMALAVNYKGEPPKHPCSRCKSSPRSRPVGGGGCKLWFDEEGKPKTSKCGVCLFEGRDSCDAGGWFGPIRTMR